MRGAFFWGIALVFVGCGLSEGGPPADTVDTDSGMMTEGGIADTGVDLNVEDRGTMMLEGGDGATCVCVSMDAENNGWTYVGTQTQMATCPTSYTDSPATLLWNPQAMNYGCSCACNGITPPTCTIPGMLSLQYGQVNCGGQVLSSPAVVPLNTCKDWDQGGLNGGMHNEQTVKISAGTVTTAGNCGNATVARKDGTISTSSAQLCGYNGQKSVCMNGDRCIETPAVPFRLCVAKADPSGTATCPIGFPKSIDGTGAGPTRVGTATDDTGITCASCNCTGGGGTCTFSVDVQDDTCNNGGGNKIFTATANCTTDGQGNSGFHPKSIKATATTAITCTPTYTSQAPMGSAKLGGTVSSVCCQ